MSETATATPVAGPTGPTGAAETGPTGPAETGLTGPELVEAPVEYERDYPKSGNHPRNKRIPTAAIIKRPKKDQPEPKVKGAKEVEPADGPLQIFDIVHKAPVQVFLIEGKALDKEGDGKLVFVQGEVSSGLFPAANAKARFAIQPDGSVIYNARGFDDVAGQEFDMLDIVKLIEQE